MNDTLKMILKRVCRVFVFFLIAALLFHLFVAERNVYWQEPDLSFSSMSTWVSFRFYTSDKRSVAPSAMLVQKAFREIDERCSLFRPDSELSKLNASAYEEPFVCSPELWDLLCLARKLYFLTDGAFDITVEPLMELWGFRGKIDRSPAELEIAERKKCTGMEKVVFDETKHTVRFTVKGMKLDLGGIAKGAALDLAAGRALHTRLVGDKLADDVSFAERFDAWFRRRLVTLDCGYINVGGNVITLPQPPPNEKSYRIGIKNPLHPAHPPCAFARMLNESVSTSGSYERFRMIDGKKCSHIIDPATGRPVENNMLSVTVITKSATVADALSTAIFIRGIELAEKIKKEYPDLRVLAFYYDKEGKICSSQIGNWEEVRTDL